MAITRIPLNPDKFAFKYKIAIDGRGYIFAFRYAARHDGWYISIYLRDGTAVRTGVRLVVGLPIFVFNNDPLLPRQLVLIRTDENQTAEATIDSFNGTVRLVRVTGDDIPAPSDETIPVTVEEI